MVEGLFDLIDDKDSSKQKLLNCRACEKYDNIRLINVENPDYEKKYRENLPRWFLNFKRSLLRHLDQSKHTKAAEEYSAEHRLLTDKRKSIMNAIRYLSYFAIKSNLAFDNYPQLLATVNRCDVEIGNINQSSYFIQNYLALIDDILVEDTVSWLNDQKDQTVSITLDIGTCNGMTLLTVLFICGSDVRLANVLLTDSKKGDKLAELCFKALTMKNKIDEETLKRKICGVVGDGAFMRKN